MQFLGDDSGRWPKHHPHRETKGERECIGENNCPGQWVLLCFARDFNEFEPFWRSDEKVVGRWSSSSPSGRGTKTSRPDLSDTMAHNTVMILDRGLSHSSLSRRLTPLTGCSQLTTCGHIFRFNLRLHSIRVPGKPDYFAFAFIVPPGLGIRLSGKQSATTMGIRFLRNRVFSADHRLRETSSRFKP